MLKILSHFIFSTLLILFISEANAKFFLKQSEDLSSSTLKSHFYKKVHSKRSLSQLQDKTSVSIDSKKIQLKRNSKISPRFIRKAISANKKIVSNLKIKKSKLKKIPISLNNIMEKNKNAINLKRNSLPLKRKAKKNINIKSIHNLINENVYSGPVKKNQTSILRKDQKQPSISNQLSFKFVNTEKNKEAKTIQHLKEISPKTLSINDQASILRKDQKQPSISNQLSFKFVNTERNKEAETIQHFKEISPKTSSINDQASILRKNHKQPQVLDQPMCNFPKNSNEILPLHSYDFTVKISDQLKTNLEQNQIEELKNLKLKIYNTSPKDNNCVLYSFINNDEELLGKILENQGQAKEILSQGYSPNFMPVRRKIFEDVFKNLDKVCHSQGEKSSIRALIHSIRSTSSLTSDLERQRTSYSNFIDVTRTINQNMDLFMPQKINSYSKEEGIQHIKTIFSNIKFMENYANKAINENRKIYLSKIINDNIFTEKIYWLLMSQEQLGLNLSEKLLDFIKVIINSQFLTVQGKLSDQINYIEILNSGDLNKIPTEEVRNVLKNSPAFKEYIALILQEDQNYLINSAQSRNGTDLKYLDIFSSLYDMTIYKFSYQDNNSINKNLILDQISIGKNRKPIYIHATSVHASKALKVNP